MINHGKGKIMSDEMFTSHISKKFDEELESLRTQFLSMGGLIEKQFTDAIHALLDANIDLAEEVITKDHLVNDLEGKLDASIEKILARRQPTARDLRLVMMMSKSITDLERMGDEAAKIARVAKAMVDEGESPRGYRETRNISNQVRLMIYEVLDSFARFDLEQAVKVMHADTVIDEEYQSAMRSLLTYIMEDGKYISRVINVMWVLRAIERVGDHGRNIAEQVIYVISGKDVRHIGFTELENIINHES